MKTLFIIVLDLLICLGVIILVLWGEFKLLFLLFPIMRHKILSIIFIGIVTFYSIAILNGKIMEIIMSKFAKQRNPFYKKNNFVNPK